MLEIRNLRKCYGKRTVVDDVSLRVTQGQFLSLLGPSGSGKSTLLRMIAGLIRPDGGSIQIGDDVVADTRRNTLPEKRAIGMVFQDYALWPHMTVTQNIAFGLRIQRWSRQRVAERVLEMLTLVRLDGMENRYPFQLSGGQQQRVALARSLATRPRLLLLDEPLASLDTQLRQVLRDELAVLLRQIGVTSVYVTHDQTEAMEMSDVVVVLRDGHVEQIGPPSTLYDHPSTLFVETFLGPTNALTGAIERRHNATGVRVGDMILYGDAPANLDGTGVLCIRPEVVEMAREGVADTLNLVPATLMHSGFAGGRWQHVCALAGDLQVRLFSHGALGVDSGAPVQLYLPPESCRILPPDKAVKVG